MTLLNHSVENGVSLWRGGPDDGTNSTPLLFLHAGGTGADVICRLAESFAVDRQVIVPDFPGYGKTPTDPALAVISERVGLVKALLEQHDGPVDIVGHSMGAFMALQASIQWPDKIGKLVAIEPVAFGAIATGYPEDAAAFAIDQNANTALVEAYDRGGRDCRIHLPLKRHTLGQVAGASAPRPAEKGSCDPARGRRGFLRPHTRQCLCSVGRALVFGGG